MKKHFSDFDTWKLQVIKESKNYQFLKKANGKFNEQMLKDMFDHKMTAIQACNAMIEIC